MKKQYLISAIVGVAIAAGIILYMQKPLAVVGQTKILKKDASYRDKIVFLSFPEEKRSLGLYQLIKSATHLEIMKKYGMDIKESQLQAESDRIDQNTRDPEQLKKIKDIFGSDHEAYLQDFVMPNLVDHKIYYDLFLNDENIQKDSLTKANQFINEVKDKPKSFRIVADSNKITVKRLHLSLKKGMQWEGVSDLKKNAAPPPPPGMKIVDQSKTKSKVAQQVEADFEAAQSTIEEARKWHELAVQFMKEDEVSAAPLNREQEWLVLHLVKQKSKEEFDIDVAFFPKLDFGKWLENEKAMVPTKINDSSYLVPK